MNKLDEMLESVEWKEFAIGDLFDVKRGKNFPKKDWIDGDVPIVTTTGLNNGVSSFIGNHNKYLSENTISVAGTGTVGSTFYHPYEYNIGEWVLSLDLKEGCFNKFIGLFISSTVSLQKDKYSYAYKLGNQRLKRQKILLPVDSRGNPNWEFMESYMKEVEKEVKPQIEFEEHIITDDRELDEVDWGEFRIGDLFDVVKGKCTNSTALVETDGNIPYVGATDNNNGVMKFVLDSEGLVTKGGGVIFVMQGQGSVGKNFYKHEDFIGTTSISIGYNPNVNEHTGSFIATVANMIEDKYSFGYSRNLKRLVIEKILLPINQKGEPDWDFMEQYMKRVENELMAEV